MSAPTRSWSALAVCCLIAGACAVGLLAQAVTPETQLQLGQSQYANGLYGEALASFQRAAVAEDARVHIPARAGVVQSALRIAQFGIARGAAAALVQEQPRDAAILALYGDAMWSSGLFEEADHAYAESTSIDAQEARGHNGRARTLSARGQFEAALYHAVTAVKLAPKEPDFYYTLGAAYRRMGRYADAAAALSDFVTLLPKGDQDERAAWARSTIMFLRSFGATRPNRILGDPNAVHTLPFRLVNEKIIVWGRINGGPQMEFVVDTGAEMATVSRRTALRQDITGVASTVSAGVGEIGLRGLQIGRLDQLEIGTLRVADVPCIIKTPALVDLPTPERESLSPLALGLSMAVDYGHRTVTLARQLPADPGPADETMNLWLTRLATVRGVVADSHARSFVVDTGGQVISISTDTARALPQEGLGRKIALKVYGASGWDRDAYLLPGVNLAFNDIRFPKMSVVVLNLRAPSVLLGYDVGGIIGHQFLSKYRVVFDLEKAELRLMKLPS